MTSRRWREPARRVWNSLWFVPAVYVLLAIGLRSISASSAVAALSALSSDMLAFTGFVTAVVLLVIQYGSSQFSPRFVAWFRRDPTLKFALKGFSATFVFAWSPPRRSAAPAVNDPTTAVQSLDRIEDLLRYAAVK